MAPKTHATRLRSASLLVVLALLLGLVPASCGGSTRNDARAQAEIRELIRQREYDRALQLSEELHRQRPDDAELREAHRQATAAWLLHRGQQASFDDRPEEALVVFERAREIAPESELVRRWIDKTNLGIAEKWLAVALGHYASGDLGAAIEAYGAALDHVPGLPSALRGLEEVMVLRNYRDGKGDGHYIDGVHALSEYWLDEARWKFTATSKYLPEYPRATSRRGQTEEMLAEERLVVAANLEAAGLFGAALSVYGQALRLAPGNTEAQIGRERVAPEAEASGLLSQAVMSIARERFDEALSQLDRAANLTERQQDRVVELREKISTARLESAYRRASSLEKDQRYPEAIKAYADLLDLADYYKDAQTRRGTLEQYVRMAAEFYDKAAAESDPELRLEYLRAIRGFWSEYRDVGEQILDLEARLGSAPSD